MNLETALISLITVEGVQKLQNAINVEWRVEKIKKINKRGGGIFFLEGGIFQNR